jgi:hypothetical protein
MMVEVVNVLPTKSTRKQTIPKALREAVWITHAGRVFERKCLTPWCLNIMSVFDFQTGHNIPESKGGPTTIDNLVPICSRCNLSMSNNYTFKEWSEKYREAPIIPRRGFMNSIIGVFRRIIRPKATVRPAVVASLPKQSKTG